MIIFDLTQPLNGQFHELCYSSLHPGIFFFHVYYTILLTLLKTLPISTHVLFHWLSLQKLSMLSGSPLSIKYRTNSLVPTSPVIYPTVPFCTIRSSLNYYILQILSTRWTYLSKCVDGWMGAELSHHYSLNTHPHLAQINTPPGMLSICSYFNY